MRRRAFTLLEVLVAITIGALLLTVAAEVFSTGMKGRDRISGQAADLAALRHTFEVMNRDMHSAVVPPDDSGMQFGLTSDPSSVGSDVLQFASTVGEPILVGRTANETVLVEYLVTNDPRDGVPTLFRYETAYPVPGGSSGGTAPGTSDDTRTTPLLRGVVGATYLFYSQDQQTWLDSWDGQTGLPTAIRVDLAIQDPKLVNDKNVEPKKESWMFSLPAAKYADDQAAAAANASSTGTGTSGTGASQ